MDRKKQGIVLFAVTLLVSVVLLAGCGKKDKTAPAPVGTAGNTAAQNQGSRQEEMVNVPNPSQPMKEKISGSSLMDLVGKGKSMECTWEVPNENNAGMSSGIVYVSGDKFRTDMQMTDAANPQGNMDIHVVSDGVWMYTWTSLDPTNGSKMELVKMKELGEKLQQGADMDSANKSMAELEKKMDYTCGNWSADAAMFTPPANVTFIDATQSMLELEEGMKNINMDQLKSQMCAMCQKAATPSEKQDCMANAGCAQ